MKHRRKPGSYPRGETTRRRIVENAIDVFATRGYEGATTRVLAERAGVKLPAIQYYFGNKEGLYRAAVAHIIEDVETRMAPVAEKVDATLTGGELPRKEVLARLHEMLHAFVALVLGVHRPESRKLFIARTEVERMAALDPFHESMLRLVLRPCAALVGRLLDRPAEDEKTVMRTLALLGQVTIFCHKPSRRVLNWSKVDEERMRSLQTLVREHTDAIFRSVKGATS